MNGQQNHKFFTAVYLCHKKLNIKGNLATNWKKWKQIWDSYKIISHLKQTSNEYRVAMFITCVGQDALDIYNGVPFETEERRTYMNTILTLMEKHCVGKTNVIYERYFSTIACKKHMKLSTHMQQLFDPWLSLLTSVV